MIFSYSIILLFNLISNVHVFHWKITQKHLYLQPPVNTRRLSGSLGRKWSKALQFVGRWNLGRMGCSKAEKPQFTRKNISSYFIGTCTDCSVISWRNCNSHMCCNLLESTEVLITAGAKVITDASPGVHRKYMLRISNSIVVRVTGHLHVLPQ